MSTGANQGVGFETSQNLLLSSADYHALLGSRDVAKGEAAARALQSLPGLKGTISLVRINVIDDKYGRLDVLVNDSGIFSAKQPARDAFRDTLAVSVVGALSTTEAFLPLLRRSSAPRLVFVSSSIGSITHAADPNSRYYGAHASEYRASKAALNMRQGGAGEPEGGGERVATVVKGKRDADVGKSAGFMESPW
ncbi:MAG: hypothetical protein M1840_005227 [Geoglossum simile]|nr:MAG: hypothetical protein M1840_005227 [Geoglossum simile]